MVNTIDMQHMRYLNLFSKITRVSTRFCFKYNEMIVFCVPKQLVPRALGEKGKNIKQINKILGKKIRIIPIPKSVQHAKGFIGAIVSPVIFKDLEIKDDTLPSRSDQVGLKEGKGTSEIVLTAGSQSKAALIGRNKRRLLEMQGIVKDFFGREFRIV